LNARDRRIRIQQIVGKGMAQTMSRDLDACQFAIFQQTVMDGGGGEALLQITEKHGLTLHLGTLCQIGLQGLHCLP